ncbi:MAG: LacI family DNA-binding transcriptional regulator [Thermodesulfobacteriota bacterium]
MSPITMNEIAKLAGVSKSTVSRALHSPKLVNARTRHRILRLMEENRYVYNSAAAELSRRKPRTIGVLAPTTRRVGFGTTTLAIVEGADEYGLSVVLGNTRFDFETERRLLRRFQERHVGGLILTGFHEGQEALVKELTSQGIPIVITWDILEDKDVSCVGFDNYKAACVAMEYLIGLGHRRIGLIVGPYTKMRRIRRRFEGYRESLDRHGIPFEPSLVAEREPSLISGREAMGRLLSLPQIPTAVFAAADELAIGAMAAAKEKGLRIPGDISIVGFNDIEYASFCDPPLTTIRVPAYDMGQIALKVLTEMMARGPDAIGQYRLDTDLIIRQSCGMISGDMQVHTPPDPGHP